MTLQVCDRKRCPKHGEAQPLRTTRARSPRCGMGFSAAHGNRRELVRRRDAGAQLTLEGPSCTPSASQIYVCKAVLYMVHLEIERHHVSICRPSYFSIGLSICWYFFSICTIPFSHLLQAECVQSLHVDVQIASNSPLSCHLISLYLYISICSAFVTTNALCMCCIVMYG